jgi:hypothetical protein
VRGAEALRTGLSDAVINCRQAAFEGGILGKKVDLKAARWHGARKAVVGLLSMRSPHSILSFLSVGSILSAGSILSIGSVGSILSIGSTGSILSIGSAGSILGLGSAGHSPFREREDQEES